MKDRNLDVLLKVRMAREGQALATLGAERQVVSHLSYQLQEATSNLAQLMMWGRRPVEETRVIAAQRSSAAARVRQINDALYLAHMRADSARQAWIVADRDREIGQRLVDQDARDRQEAADKAERNETDDLNRGRLIIRGKQPLEQGDDL
jgi:hypothetical protein